MKIVIELFLTKLWKKQDEITKKYVSSNSTLTLNKIKDSVEAIGNRVAKGKEIVMEQGGRIGWLHIF